MVITVNKQFYYVIYLVYLLLLVHLHIPIGEYQEKAVLFIEKNVSLYTISMSLSWCYYLRKEELTNDDGE